MKSVVEVKGLSKHFSLYKKQPGLVGTLKSLFAREYFTVKAVDDISFTIEEGEFVGFIGPNGAGKTTTLKSLSGLLYPSSGSAEVLGHTPWKRDRDFLKRIALVMGQKNQLWWDLPAADSFLLNKEIYEIPDKDFSEKLAELTDLLELKEILNVQVRKLSLGQRMKCELASALLHSPEVLFLDEPTIGLDVVVQKKLRNFFKEYNQKYKTTVMLTSHYMDDVKELCKRVIIVDDGMIRYDGDLGKLIKEYAKNKNISFVTSKSVERSDLEKFGDVVDLNDGHGTISVSRKDVSQVASKLLESYPVEDLDISEMSLEDVIRELFTK